MAYILASSWICALEKTWVFGIVTPQRDPHAISTSIHMPDVYGKGVELKKKKKKKKKKKTEIGVEHGWGPEEERRKEGESVRKRCDYIDLIYKSECCSE